MTTHIEKKLREEKRKEKEGKAFGKWQRLRMEACRLWPDLGGPGGPPLRSATEQADMLAKDLERLARDLDCKLSMDMRIARALLKPEHKRDWPITLRTACRRAYFATTKQLARFLREREGTGDLTRKEGKNRMGRLVITWELENGAKLLPPLKNRISQLLDVIEQALKIVREPGHDPKLWWDVDEQFEVVYRGQPEYSPQEKRWVTMDLE
jgi:hypothetical protein